MRKNHQKNILICWNSKKEKEENVKDERRRGENEKRRKGKEEGQFVIQDWKTYKQTTTTERKGKQQRELNKGKQPS